MDLAVFAQRVIAEAVFLGDHVNTLFPENLLTDVLAELESKGPLPLWESNGHSTIALILRDRLQR